MSQPNLLFSISSPTTHPTSHPASHHPTAWVPPGLKKAVKSKGPGNPSWRLTAFICGKQEGPHPKPSRYLPQTNQKPHATCDFQRQTNRLREGNQIPTAPRGRRRAAVARSEALPGYVAPVRPAVAFVQKKTGGFGPSFWFTSGFWGTHCFTQLVFLYVFVGVFWGIPCLGRLSWCFFFFLRFGLTTGQFSETCFKAVQPLGMTSYPRVSLPPAKRHLRFLTHSHLRTWRYGSKINRKIPWEKHPVPLLQHPK